MKESSSNTETHSIELKGISFERLLKIYDEITEFDKHHKGLYFLEEDDMHSFRTYDQFYEILKGISSNIDVSVYAKPEFSSDQMAQIRKGLEEGFDLSPYAKLGYDYTRMNVIRKALKYNVDISQYDKPEFDAAKLNIILEGLVSGVDVEKYADPKLDRKQMLRIRRSFGIPLSKEFTR